MGAFEIIFMILAFIYGITAFLLLAFAYTFHTNKDITKLYGIRSSEFESVKIHSKTILSGQRNPSLIKESRDWYVETYLLNPFKIRLVRSVRHYKREVLRAVIKQNHNAAFFFQITSIVTQKIQTLLSRIKSQNFFSSIRVVEGCAHHYGHSTP